MAFPKPFSVFGGSEKLGGMLDYRGSHGSVDEARAQIDREKPQWWQIVVAQEERLEVVESSETVPCGKKSGARQAKQN